MEVFFVYPMAEGVKINFPGTLLFLMLIIPYMFISEKRSLSSSS